MAVSKNQMAGRGGVDRLAWYQPDSMTVRKFNYSNGIGWSTKRDKKRANRGKGQTSGKVKQITATYLERYMAKSNRSYKHRSYGAWFDKTQVSARV